MALYENTRPLVDGHRQMHAAGILGQFFGIFTAWNDARVTHTALSRLSDHELHDLGLHRGDIDRLSNRTRI